MHPFVIYVVWHPLFEEGTHYAELIYQTFSRNFKEPFSRSLGIPVYYRSIGASGKTDELPKEIDPDSAGHIAIVILIDDRLVIDGEQWADYLDNLVSLDKGNKRLRLFPVAISKNASKVKGGLNRKNFIRLYEKDTLEQKEGFIRISLAHEFCRLLHDFERAADADPASIPRLKLFLSHSKADGVEITKRLKNWIQEYTGLQTFFDTTDIPPGETFGDVIGGGVENSSLLIIQTDIYSTREWCRIEVLGAKKHRRPVVVVDALEKGESRSFPYMANVPVVRWKIDETSEFTLMIERIITVVLLETLRHRYQKKFLNYLFKTFSWKQDSFRMLENAPELMDMIEDDEKAKPAYHNYLYPDPPLGEAEINLLKQFNRLATFRTPVQLIRDETFKDPPQKKIRIGISISESPMMEPRGLNINHLKDMMVEAARYLLASGYSLSYGGDIKYNESFNFVLLLKDMVMTYRSDYKATKDVVTNYVAYPLSHLIAPALESELIDQVKFIKVSPPENLSINANNDWQRILKAATPQDQYLFAECLTKMRLLMNDGIDARIVVGGKLMGYKGKYPGLVEETLIAMQAGKPVFLIGAFGGCAEAIIKAILGETPEELSHTFQSKDPKYSELIKYYEEQSGNGATNGIDYKEVVAFLHEKGIKGLNNGLTEEENNVLFTSINVHEVISLLLKGFRTCSGS